jgi:hypothetical protein
VELRRQTILGTLTLPDERINEDLSRLGDLIRNENRAQERSVLLILHGLLSIVDNQAKVWEDLKSTHDRRFSDHQKMLDDHEITLLKGVTSWKWITIILGTIIPIFSSFFVYGYLTIADLRDSVKAQEAVDNYVNKTQNSLMSEGNNRIINHEDTLNTLNTEIERIKKLRAVKGSK